MHLGHGIALAPTGKKSKVDLHRPGQVALTAALRHPCSSVAVLRTASLEVRWPRFLPLGSGKGGISGACPVWVLFWRAAHWSPLLTSVDRGRAPRAAG